MLNPPSSASPLYQTLHSNALEFVASQEQDLGQPTRMNHDRIRAIRSLSGFEHRWGHNTLVSTKPPLRGTCDVAGFIQHMEVMLPHLQSWDTKVTEVIVDEAQRVAVVRASYDMHPKGADGPVENDIVWFLTFEADGKRVKTSVEFIDGAAMIEIGRLMTGGAK